LTRDQKIASSAPLSEARQKVGALRIAGVCVGLSVETFSAEKMVQSFFRRGQAWHGNFFCRDAGLFPKSGG
jgi:hypothetical protein